MIAFASLVLTLLYGLAGAAVLPKKVSPLLLCTSGMAVWYLIWLFCAISGIPPNLALTLFFIFIMALVVANPSELRSRIPDLETTGVLLLLGLPTLALLNFDQVTRWDELSHIMRNADLLRMLGHLPSASDIVHLDWRYPEFPLAYIAVGLPPMLLTGTWLPSVWSCMNWILLLLATDHILRTTKQPHLSALGQASLAFLAVLVFNPFSSPHLIASGYIDVALAVAVFAAGAPLIQKDPALRDLQDLMPCALVMILVASFKDIGFELACLITGLLAFRYRYQDGASFSDSVRTSAILLGPAACAWLLWQIHVAGLHTEHTYKPLTAMANVHLDRLTDTLRNQWYAWFGRPHALVLLIGSLIAAYRYRHRPTINALAGSVLV